VTHAVKAVYASIAFGCLGLAVPLMAAPSCPPRVLDEGEPFLDAAPVIPKKYQSIMRASKTDLAIASESGKVVCVRLGWVAQIDKFWNNPDMRFIGFDYFGYETHGHILIDRKGDGLEIATGVRPIFSPDKKHFASAQVTDSGWGNFEGVGIWSVNANGSTQNVNYNSDYENGDKLPYGIDWKIDRWVGNDLVKLSMIHPDNYAYDDQNYEKGIARSPRQFYQFRRNQKSWVLYDCATKGKCR
jgi:hypothetical protein